MFACDRRRLRVSSQTQMFPGEHTHTHTHSHRSLSISDIFHHGASLLTLSHKIQMRLDESEPQSSGSFHLNFADISPRVSGFKV